MAVSLCVFKELEERFRSFWDHVTSLPAAVLLDGLDEPIYVRCLLQLRLEFSYDGSLVNMGLSTHYHSSCDVFYVKIELCARSRCQILNIDKTQRTPYWKCSSRNTKCK